MMLLTAQEVAELTDYRLGATEAEAWRTWVRRLNLDVDNDVKRWLLEWEWHDVEEQEK